MEIAMLKKNGKEYIGAPLEKDEYLIKIFEDTAFLTKLNKTGKIPVKFLEWGYDFETRKRPDIQVINEIFREGWQVKDFRAGGSQCWARLIHPLGFIVEIYVEELFKLFETETIKNKSIEGCFKWSYGKLIKK